jgi:N-acetyl-anhydromuramyl-L-alanine amidase AmpD
MTQAADGSQAKARAFANASQEFGVPEQLLLAVSYNQSRWESHRGKRSVNGGYGLMNLTTNTPDQPEDNRGDQRRPHDHKQSKLSRYTLDDAANLLHTSPETLKNDDQQNIRGAAAVLAQYAKQNNGGQLPGSTGEWYDAVAAYSGAEETDSAAEFADEVYKTVESGEARTTTEGQNLNLSATQNPAPQRERVNRLGLKRTPKPAQDTQCPRDLNCRFVPAGYAANSADPADYGNYDHSNRPNDMKINTIVIHDTEGSYQSAIDHFQDTTSYVSCHYVIRSSDGAITQMVRNEDVAWCAGDWYDNMHSINIEHEGIAAEGAAWYTEAMYQSSAKLVRYLARQYDIPLDRQHIVGHDNEPTISPSRLAGQHWDPGPYWDWEHYMDLLNASDKDGREVNQRTKTLTISPEFATNQPSITDCSSGTCTPLPAQGTNWVYLHSAANAASPLLSDPYLHPDSAPGTNHIDDWSARAVSGSKYAVAGQQGDWIGIWYGGKIGWFLNPTGASKTAHATRAKTVTPKAGLATVPVYGAAYPEAAAFPATIPVQTLTPLYTLPAGQAYVMSGGDFPTDYFYDATINSSLPDDHMVVRGTDVYYQITFNHRHAYVKATDVNIQ